MTEKSDSDATCPKCQAPIPDGAPRGLCPRCLLDGAMASEPRLPSEGTAPKAEELAAVFPQFEIIELLGAGAMGLVYKARQPHLDRLVALKILSPELAQDPMFSERFAREARALAKLNHPSIVQCYDFGQSNPKGDGACYYYLVLEYVDGVNLRQSMQAGALSAREALGIVPRLCDALHYAHEQGVLHRDIKPENILIDRQGRVKIADFGLARFQKDSASDAMTLTASGAQLGTAAYMAPEQIEQPHDVDHRADIYSLGVVFYEMLTGGLPLGRFAAPSETSGVDPRLDSVVFRTLEKQADRRFQSAGEVRTQVEGIASTPTPKHKPAAFSKPEHEPSTTSLRSIKAAAFPPNWATAWTWFWRQPFLLRSGQLSLEPDRLIFTGDKDTLTIPLESIEEVSLAPMPFAVEPLGRCPIAVRWRDPAGIIQSTHFLIEPFALNRRLPGEQTVVDEWMQALRTSISEGTGKEPACQHDADLRCADVTPPPPAFGKITWIIFLGLSIFLAGMLFVGGFDLADSGNELIGLILLAGGIALGLATAGVGFGLWRRRQKNEKTAGEEQPPADSDSKKSWARDRAKRARDWVVERRKTRVSSATPDGEDNSESEAGPRWSHTAIIAFLLATLGWALFMIGPVIGCVLGWVALFQIKRSDGKLKGRGMALFSAVQIPVIVLMALLVAPVTFLWDQGQMPFNYATTVLILAVLTFTGLRLILWLAGVSGWWKWIRTAGFAAILMGATLLIGITWAVKDGQTRWPFRGTLVSATVDHDNVNRSAIVSSLREGKYGEQIHIVPFSEDSNETYLFAVMDREFDAVDLLERAGDDLRMHDSGTTIRVQEHDSLPGWPPRGRDAEVFFVVLAAISCASGLFFALSGFASGGISLLLSSVVCIGLIQSSLPFPIGIRVHDADSPPISNPVPVTPGLPADDAGLR